jgi:hypothetical protein
MISRHYQTFKDHVDQIELVERFCKRLGEEGFRFLAPNQNYYDPSSDVIYRRILDMFGIDMDLLELDIERKVTMAEMHALTEQNRENNHKRVTKPTKAPLRREAIKPDTIT